MKDIIKAMEKAVATEQVLDGKIKKQRNRYQLAKKIEENRLTFAVQLDKYLGTGTDSISYRELAKIINTIKEEIATGTSFETALKAATTAWAR